MRQNLYAAVFAAGITLVLTCLMIGVKLTSEGTRLKVVGAYRYGNDECGAGAADTLHPDRSGM